MMTPFDDILNEVKRVLAERESTYKGSAQGQFKGIAAIASAIAHKDITASDVAVVLLALKLERAKADPTHLDSAVDMIGYVLHYHKELCADADIPSDTK